MNYKSLRECVNDLERHGQLVRIKKEVNPYLEMAEIQRRVFQAKGPAILFENVKDSPFTAVSNLFGTIDRTRFIFRSTLKRVKKLIKIKADPSVLMKNPFRYFDTIFTLAKTLPQKNRNGSVFYAKTSIDKLPQIYSWPEDGGPFILLPQVYSEDPLKPGILNSNLGMYRIQMAGNNYKQNEEIGLHYQIRRDIGIHHTNALKKGEPLRVSIFVGGPPSHTFAAVMPLPEGIPEVLFAGALGGRRFRYSRREGHIFSTDADFCITGTIIPGKTKPEGPFGDHLGYYSLKHPYPVLKVDSVYHRRNAIWPFTVVGRPPQEDTSFGSLIQEIVEPMAPVEIPGLKSMHAVDAAGVHPLMLAIGKERFAPYEKYERPQEILKIANAILGYGHPSFAKYLFIAAEEDNLKLNVHDIEYFFRHILERIDLRRDLHFQTMTTVDSLDYTGTAFNEGSKVIVAVRGARRRTLMDKVPATLSLTSIFKDPRVVFNGILALKAPPFKNYKTAAVEIDRLCKKLANVKELKGFPLILLADDSQFISKNINNFLWITFTRSNPSHDIYGIKSFIENKHWGCDGSLIIDVRLKSHHAPPLIEDPKVTKAVDELAKPGGCLHGII
ncbi:MAG: UbiD family decarboxylase [Spirochaetia bacterium]|nr:UbiD family decarboxylase [Spirochaetia bacterium]